jgi:hypothetical protein
MAQAEGRTHRLGSAEGGGSYGGRAEDDGGLGLGVWKSDACADGTLTCSEVAVSPGKLRS